VDPTVWNPIVWDWTHLVVRWIHLITGIAWIGASFYFIHLDASLRRSGGLPAGVAGEAWQVHGGGFYRMQKYLVAPPELPKDLTWFKYEAYSTWLSGFVLLGLIYYLSADLFLIDPAVMDLPVWAAILISVASLALGWVLYDRLCRSRLGENTARLCALGFVFLVAASWGYTQVFSGRGAYIHAGSLIGTIMVANVFFVIIPNQKIVVADLVAGRTPDPALGQQAGQRSLHNNYLTLPVLFLMISNHYPLAFGTRWNWLIVAVVIIVGAVIRHFYNMRHAGRPNPWWTWAIATAGMALVVWLSAAGPVEEDLAAVGSRASGSGTDASEPAARPVDFVEVENIVLSRCSMCHAAEPFWEGILAPPKGIRLDTPEMIRAHARQIQLQATLSHAMPPGNITELSAEERRVLAAWIAAGAPAE
jgi:uncharacterized membrane protein